MFLHTRTLIFLIRCYIGVVLLNATLRTARQEDAHEYMVHLLESMHKCCLPSGVPYESPSAHEKSLVHKIFGGCLRSQMVPIKALLSLRWVKSPLHNKMSPTMKATVSRLPVLDN